MRQSVLIRALVITMLIFIAFVFIENFLGNRISIPTIVLYILVGMACFFMILALRQTRAANRALVHAESELAERKQAEDALRKSEERYRMLFNDAPVMILEEDFSATKIYLDELRQNLEIEDFKEYLDQRPDLVRECLLRMKLISVNDSVLTFYGARDASHLLENLPHTFTASSFQAFKDALIYIVEDRAFFECETMQRRLSGEVRHVFMRVFASPSELGNFSRVIMTMLDITERKRIEDAQLFLSQQGGISGEDFFKSLARYLGENLGMDYVCIDRLQAGNLAAQTVAVYFDGQFDDNVTYTLKDTPCGDVVGKSVCCFPNGVRHLFPRDAVLQDMVAESYIGVTLWNSDKHPIGLIALIGRQPLESPQFAESVLNLVSIRAAGELERQQAEFALRESEARYAALVDASPDAITLIDINGSVLTCNRQAAALHGFQDVHEMRACNVFDLLAAEEHRIMRKNILHAQNSAGGNVFECTMLKKDGTRFSGELSVSVILNDHGKPDKFIGISRDISDRKRVEQETLKLRNAVEHSADIIFITDRNGAIEYVNPAFVSVTGYNREDVVGRTPGILSSGLMSAEHYQHLWETIQSGAVFRAEFVNKKKSGELFHYDQTITPVTNSHGQITHFVSTGKDVTERKRIEAQLRESREDFEGYFNMNAVGMAVSSPAMGWLEMNDRLCQMLGYSREELRQLTWADITHPGDLEANLQLFNLVLTGETDSYQLDKRFICKDKSLVYTTIFVSCKRNPDGSVRHLLVSIVDITDRKQMEESLHQSETMYRILAENISDVIWILDLNESRFRYVSPSVERLRGYTPDEVLAQDMSAALTPESLEGINSIMSERLQAFLQGYREFYVHELEQPCKNGGTVWTEATASFHINESNNHIEVYGVSRDISERKRLQDELHNYVKEIEQLQENLREQAIRDPLTGLYNRRYMQDVFTREFSRAARENYPISIIMLDMDDLKKINDTYGHQSGDFAILTLASHLQDMIRVEDIICRYGGDEFIILLAKTNPADALRRVAEWRETLQSTPVDIDEKTMRIKFTAGVASFPAHGTSVEEVINYADVALYRAKTLGRDRVAVFEQN